MTIPFVSLPTDVHNRIVAYIYDRNDALSMRATCSLFAELIPVPHAMSLPERTQLTQSALFALQSLGASSSSSSSSSYSGASPTTTQPSSNNTSDTEDEWVFSVTADMTRRLSLLPTQASHPSIPYLPTEIHLEIFSYLDQIDSCCLGLASRRTYSIYLSIFGTKLPLSTRRSGPNNLERAWGVVGKQMCTHCGFYRCELYKHLESWMPSNLEYCSMLQNFGPKGEGEHAKSNCYRVKPSKPRRCGRHPVRTTSLHQDDASASTAMAAFASAL